MRRLIWLLGMTLALTPALRAQDSTDAARRDRLQQAIERRFGEVVRRQLGLTDDQARRLRETEERFRPRRRAIVQRQVRLRGALRQQMLPGTAADPDSVRRLMSGLQTSRADLLQLDREQDQEMAGYLSPVQRARYQMLRERLLTRLQEIRRQRAQDRGPMRPRRQP